MKPVMQCFAVWLLALAPLTDSQQMRLDSVGDDALRDTAGLAALLEHVLTWEDVPESMPRQPDYPLLYEEAGDWRGELFVIEGEFALQQTRRISLPGDLPSEMTEWAIKVADDPEETVLIYFPDELEPPEEGQRVIVTGRFYKVLHQRLQGGGEADFLTFVGRYPQVLPMSAKTSSTTPLAMLLIVFLALFALAGVLIWIKKQQARPVRIRKHLSADEQPQEQDPPINLPEDPAQALAQLADDEDALRS